MSPMYYRTSCRILAQRARTRSAEGGSGKVSRSGQISYLRCAAWSFVAAAITAAAGLAGLNWNARVGELQIIWISVASFASLVYAIYLALSNARTSEKIDYLDVTLTGIAAGDKNKAIALLAKAFSLYVAQVVGVLDKPDDFVSLVDTSLSTLHYVICRCHGTDDDKLKVFFFSYESMESRAPENQEVGSYLQVRSYPPDRRNRVRLDELIQEQMDAVMSRRYPYGSGWLKSRKDGSPARDEYEVLPPREAEISSYIRVGIPQIGVICVDSSDDAAPLSVADRELALTFADILMSPAMIRILPTIHLQPS